MSCFRSFPYRTVLHAALQAALLILLLAVVPAFAAQARGKLPAEVDNALSDMFDALSPREAPSQSAMNVILAFVAGNGGADDRIRPADRPEGAGVLRHTTLKVPLRTVLDYLVNPDVPGEVTNPSSVRINDWQSPDIRRRAEAFRNTPLPSTSPVVLRDTEFEETTPDVSSGGWYSYTLNRLFVLTSYQGRAALFSVSRMPGSSSVGRKGAVVGNDADWTYVYTPVTGTNLALVGRAETYLYGSSSVSVFLETVPGGDTTEMYIFKWAKAGWAGMNVVRPSHLRDGVDRFFGSLHAVLESPQRPLPQAVAAWRAELDALDDAALRQRLKGFAEHLAALGKDDSLLSGKDFQAVLAGGNYASSLTRRQMIAELLKLHLRKQLGRPVPADL